MALPLVCRAYLFSLHLHLFFLSFCSASSLFSTISRVGATMDRACLTTIKGRPRDARLYLAHFSRNQLNVG